MNSPPPTSDVVEKLPTTYKRAYLEMKEKFDSTEKEADRAEILRKFSEKYVLFPYYRDFLQYVFWILLYYRASSIICSMENQMRLDDNKSVNFRQRLTFASKIYGYTWNLYWIAAGEGDKHESVTGRMFKRFLENPEYPLSFPHLFVSHGIMFLIEIQSKYENHAY